MYQVKVVILNTFSFFARRIQLIFTEIVIHGAKCCSGFRDHHCLCHGISKFMPRCLITYPGYGDAAYTQCEPGMASFSLYLFFALLRYIDTFFASGKYSMCHVKRTPITHEPRHVMSLGRFKKTKRDCKWTRLTTLWSMLMSSMYWMEHKCRKENQTDSTTR